MAEFKKSNYRKKYLEYFGLKDDTNFQVHHIDLDRNNNSLNNLVLLPKELHRNIHSNFQNIYGRDKKSFTVALDDICTIVCCGGYIQELIEDLQIMRCWCQYRDLNYLNHTGEYQINIKEERCLYLQRKGINNGK